MLDAPRETSEQHRLLWWKEVLIIVTFYAVYTWIRNRFGSARLLETGEPVHAFNNALRVIRVERALGLFHEESIQQHFLAWRGFIKFWNVYYGTAHFIVTILAFVLVFKKAPAVFPRYRNTLAFTTAFALIGFSMFPLMPPRLLDDTSHYGGRRIAESRQLHTFGFEDTMATVGGLWSFDSGAVSKVSNQYAAMPSLHTGWATWCALSMWPLLRRKWMRGLLLLYPMATLFCIIVTGNHYWIDGLGGLVTLSAGFLAGDHLHQWNQRRLRRLRAARATETAAH